MSIARRPVISLLVFVGIIGVGLVSSASAQRVFRAVLDGAQEVPSVSTTATGTGVVTLNAAETHISYRLEFTGLTSNQTASHIHGASPRGVSSGVLINIGSNGVTSGVFFADNVPITSLPGTPVADLKNGLWYFNVHSNGFPGGEIRGQIEPDCANLSAGLVSWWQGEGNALDQNAIANGNLENGAGFAAGVSGRAFSLDGTDDRVLVGNPAGMQVQDFTIEGWIKRSSATIVSNNPFPGFDQGIFVAYGSGGYGMAIDRVTGRLLLTKVDESQVLAPSLPITDTNYHHVAVTKSAGTVTFYVDGLASGPVGYAPTFTFGTNAAIGRRGDANSTNTFFGAIDELSVYSTPLNGAQIASIYNAGASGKCPPCVPTPVGLNEWWTGDGNLLGVRNRSNGFLSGATFSEGRNGAGFSFNGSSAFVVPDAPQLNPTSQITFEAWVYPTSDSGSGPAFQIIANKESTGPTIVQYEFARRFSGGFCPSGDNSIVTGNFAMAIGGLAGLPDHCGGWVNGGGNLPLNTWSHVAATYDGSNLRAFVNGANTATYPANGSLPVSAGSFQLGGRSIVPEFWTGRIDEAALYGRALSIQEVAAIANAGRACKCKPGATTAPADIVGWWAGDGNANNILGGGFNGTLQNGAGFAVAKVGQGFLFDGVDDSVSVPTTPLTATDNWSMEAWIKPATLPQLAIAVSNGFDNGGSGNGYAFGIGNGSGGSGNMLQGLLSGITFINTGYTFPAANEWYHVAMVRSQGLISFYVNGVQAPAFSESAPSTPTEFRIGSQNGIRFFNGQVDEVGLFNRALSQFEIESIYNAGLAGKYKSATITGPPPLAGKGSNDGVINSVAVGDATVSFPAIFGAGMTQQVPLDLSQLPLLPVFSAGLTYDISTTVGYAGSPQVCFNLPSFTPAQFANLRIYHLENDNWINRTGPAAYPNLCTTGLTSLSPFAIGAVAPTSANVSISGRVTTADGSGVRNAILSMTDPDGVTRTARTSSFGYYRFDAIQPGRTYVISVASKRYTFSPRAVMIEDELAGLDFIASP